MPPSPAAVLSDPGPRQGFVPPPAAIEMWPYQPIVYDNTPSGQRRGNAVARRSCLRRQAVEKFRVKGRPLACLDTTAARDPLTVDYPFRVLCFRTVVSFLSIPFTTPMEVDAAMALYMGDMFANGEHVQTGRTTLAGFVYFFAEYGNRAPYGLPRTRRALDNWTKREFPYSRWPLLLCQICSIACVLATLRGATWTWQPTHS